MADALPPEIALALHSQNEQLTKINLRLDRMFRLLDGDPNDDIAGIRPRLTKLEQKFESLPPDLGPQLKLALEQITTLKQEWQNLQQRYVGAKWVLGILGVTNLVTVAALARFLLGLG